MIGLAGVLPPAGDHGGVAILESLPAPPAPGFEGVVVRCDDPGRLAAALDWFASVRRARPGFAFGVVCQPEHCAVELGAFTHPVNPVVSPADLESGRLPRRALEALREASIEGRILEALITDHGEAILGERAIIECLITHAVCGRTLTTAARSLGRSVDTVERRLARLGLRPGRLMRAARVRAYDLRLELGASPADALAASGWRDAGALRKARKRLR